MPVENDPEPAPLAAARDSHQVTTPGVDDLRTDAERRLFEIWETTRKDFLPPRSAFGPAVIVDYARAVAVVDIVRREDGGRDYRFRYFGAELESAAGDMSGKLLSERPNDAWHNRAVASFTTAVETRRPVLGVGPSTHPGEEDIVSRGLILPLSEDGETVTGLVALVGAALERSARKFLR